MLPIQLSSPNPLKEIEEERQCYKDNVSDLERQWISPRNVPLKTAASALMSVCAGYMDFLIF